MRKIIIAPLLLSAVLAFSKDTATTNVTITAVGWQIEIGFSHTVDPTDSIASNEEGKAQYRIFDVTSGQVVRVALSEGHKSSLVLQTPEQLEPDHVYLVYILDLRFNGKQPTDLLQSEITVPETNAPQQSEHVRKKWVAADGRDDANIYLSGELTKAQGAKATGSVDAKLDYQLPLHNASKRLQSFGLTFDAQASNAPQADPDAIKGGLYWKWLPIRCQTCPASTPFRSILWTNTIGFDAEKDFATTDFLWTSQFTIVSKTWGMKNHTQFYMRPSLGNELGVNIASRLPALEQRRLRDRPFIGINLVATIPVGIPGLQRITWEGSYIRRWPLTNELMLTENSSGAFTTVSFGTQPRQFATMKLSFMFSRMFGANVGYKYGQDAPGFKFVDHTITLGLVYKAKTTQE
jgi:hypothetical protein